MVGPKESCRVHFGPSNIGEIRYEFHLQIQPSVIDFADLFISPMTGASHIHDTLVPLVTGLQWFQVPPTNVCSAFCEEAANCRYPAPEKMW